MTPNTQTVMQEVDYDDATHRYTLKERLYRSSTQIVEKFITHFDTEERTQYMADRYGGTPAMWKTRWREINDISKVRGTELHGQQEDFLYSRGFDSVMGKEFRVYNNKYATWGVDYSRLPDGIYPEMKLWRHDWGIAGRVDKPILDTVNGKRFAHIEDYKTGKRIRRESYKDLNGFYQMMLGPCSHLMDCEFSHYSLQLSLYQFMLEYFGFIPGSRRIIHYPHAIEDVPGVPKPVIYDVPYLKTEVKAMLHELKRTGWLH